MNSLLWWFAREGIGDLCVEGEFVMQADVCGEWAVQGHGYAVAQGDGGAEADLAFPDAGHLELAQD